VAIARAVVNCPALILADEPTSALDDANCATVVALLRAQAEASGATLLIATHDARLKAHFTHRLELPDRP
jgi:putative ABC transport system ATP-binding protein